MIFLRYSPSEVRVPHQKHHLLLDLEGRGREYRELKMWHATAQNDNPIVRIKTNLARNNVDGFKLLRPLDKVQHDDV